MTREQVEEIVNKLRGEVMMLANAAMLRAGGHDRADAAVLTALQQAIMQIYAQSVITRGFEPTAEGFAALAVASWEAAGQHVVPAVRKYVESVTASCDCPKCTAKRHAKN